MAKDNNFMASALDRQISDLSQDAFGHRHFAAALRSLIESPTHAPPFSIGLLGGWGTGKSTIKELYVHDLENDAHKNSGGLTRSDRIRCITFNAWRFGGKEQDIKRALLRHVFLELGGDDENLQDRLFRQISQSSEENKSWWAFTWEVLKAWARPIPAFIISLLILVFFLYLALNLLHFQNEIAKSIILVALTLIYPYLFKAIKPSPVSAQNSITRIDLPSTTAEQYEDLLLTQITRFKAGKSSAPDRKKGKRCERIVVFVDDLDRLSAEEMVLGLDAVRTFMEIPETRLPSGLGLVFVISCDEAKVAHALVDRRKQGDMPGTVFKQSDARRYLDRIFQFRLEIPPFPRQDMRKYATKKLHELPGIVGDLRSRGVQVENLVDRMIHIGVQDPRNALQIVNAFAHSWWLAKKRETEELGTERAGGLHEGAVTKHPLSLGAIAAIKVNFPDFYRDLQNDPSLLQRLTDVLIRRKPLAEQPLPVQQTIIENYIKGRDGSQDTPLEVLPVHRPLRQFLANLVGLRWPDSLQSLLLLSEDPITRKFGEKSRPIYEAFVSGDVQGVLEGLGRQSDANPLTSDETHLLYQMAEGLRNESEVQRINAMRVIADLVDRLPPGTLNLLVGPLSRELADSQDLRSQLGLAKIGKILGIAAPEDRKAIASRLIDDVLTVNEDIHFLLETLEPPNLEEAISFARVTVPMVLPIRRECGLDPASDAQLLAWLVDRTVNIQNKNFQIPFVELEDWMSEHADNLLPGLSHRYVDLVASELEGTPAAEFDPLPAIERVKKVFESLWSAGEKTRPVLWNNLIRFVAIKQPDAAKAAWEAMRAHMTAPNSSLISKFVTNFTERLTKYTKDKNWTLNFEEAVSSLFSITRTRKKDLEDSALSSLAGLAILWSEHGDNFAKLSCDLTDDLKQIKPEITLAIYDNWAQRIIDNLPIICVQNFATQFPNLQNSAQSAASAQLQQVISTDNIDEDSGNRYKTFVEAVPEASWDEGPLQTHLQKLFPQIAARHNNPNHYLERVFPPITKVFNHVPKNILGSALHNLFVNAKNTPNVYAWLHSCMAGLWPKQATELNPYNPQTIFQDGVNFAQTQPTLASRGLLLSLQRMITQEIVPTSQRSAVIEAACSIWQAAPEKAVKTFLDGFNELSHAQTADLLTTIQLDDAEQLELLQKAWTVISETQEMDDRVLITNLILEKGTAGTQEEPDRGLRLWIDVQGESSSSLLTNAIIQDDLSDLHRKRLWYQIVRLAPNLSHDFFLDVIPKIVGITAIDETASALFSDFDHVSRTLGTTDNRAELSQRLMRLFPEAGTKTIKASILEWCRKLNGKASLRVLEPPRLNDDDMAILETHFPGDSYLQKLEMKREQGNQE